jgi:glycosyltransferase involved in cell wall biosynthesis
MATRIVVTVISDLITDQRVHKVCQTLHDQGYRVKLIGAKKIGSLALVPKDYTVRRIAMLFQRGFLFYAEFNTRLFFRLLFGRADAYLGNDLDVMAATFAAAKLKGKPIVYDTHEYYLGMAGLENKPRTVRIWKALESYVFARVPYIYTVCDSICALYKKDYGKDLVTVRNVPYLQFTEPGRSFDSLIAQIDQQIPQDRRILLFEGAGINPHRGVEELVLAMQYLDPQVYHLLIVGGGDVLVQVKRLVLTHELGDRITFIHKVPFEVLRHIIRQADLGLSLDKTDNLNHRLGLPNKIFDYLHANVPVLVSRLVESEKIVATYQVGAFIENHDPVHIASCISNIFADRARMEGWKENTERVRRELNWENEGKIVLRIFEQLGAETVN